IALFPLISSVISPAQMKGKLSLALDTIQDPGNLGTIIRLADWFGIENVICSEETVDVFNPKVIQATMGAIARVKVRYTNLSRFLAECSELDIPVYGTFLNGDIIYKKELSEEGIIVMGNEGNGISEAVADQITDRLFIPSFPPDQPTSESLNVAVATSIICSEFRRQHFIS
ncbi:MAG: RNA methyltransferase, partial [Bacteroidota bacterium]|nr:RNA methyltransferase [Bacteroidota bacterium]